MPSSLESKSLAIDDGHVGFLLVRLAADGAGCNISCQFGMNERDR